MPDINDIFGGTTLKADDLREKGRVICTIENVAPKEFTESKDGQEVKKKKLEIFFAKAKKTLICNVTNANRIAAILGTTDYSLWPGSQIGLRVEKVPFGKKMVDGIVVFDPGDRIESGPQPKKQAAPIEEEMNDEIPF